MATSLETRKLNIALFPLLAHGHMLPMLDMAKLFASRGLRTTIIATSAFADLVKQAQESGHDIGLTVVEFPPQGSSLPNHVVSLDKVPPDLLSKFSEAIELLQEPVEKLLQELSPNCLVSDMFLPWTADSAAKLGFPRLIFNGTSYFALYAAEQMRRQKPYMNVSSDDEPFSLDLPHKLEFVRTELSPIELQENQDPYLTDFKKVIVRIREAEEKSYGVLMNSFYELESSYVDCYRDVLGKRAWHIGPLLLCKKGDDQNEERHECLTWLDSRIPNSVVYLCFRSFTPTQLREMAIGIESSGQDFIWVVRKSHFEEDNEDWLPDGFEERLKGKGLIVRGWAPQKTILDHPSIGAFVSHCGWNSTIEAICSGVPIAAWPLGAEQFYNAKLVTDVLKLGVSVGNKKWQNSIPCEGVSSEALAKAVERIMIGEEAAEIRSRSKGYKELARKAFIEGGSSYNCLNDLINELKVYA